MGKFAKKSERSPYESQLLLSELLDQLGTSVRVLWAPGGESPVVTTTEFAEVADDLPDAPGTLMFMMSSSALSRDELERLLEQAVHRGFSGVAMKCRSSRQAEISAMASNSGIAVLEVAEHVSWRYFDVFVSSILSERNPAAGLSRQEALEPLFALSNSLAEVFGGSVAIEDLGRNILAYSSVPGQLIDDLRTRGILSRQVPTTVFNDEQYRAVLKASGPRRFPQFGDDHARTAVAVRAGSVPLGTIWAIDAHADSTDVEEGEKQAALTHAAKVAASHMLENWRVQEANQRPREDVLRRLLTGTNLTGTELAELGVSEGGSVILTGFSLMGSANSPIALRQMRTTIAQNYSAYRRESCVVVVDRRIYVLIHSASLQEARSVASRILRVVDKVVEGKTVAAIAQPAHHSAALVPRREEVDAILQCHTMETTEPVLLREDVQAQMLVNRVHQTFASDPTVAIPRLSDLLEKESHGKGNLCQTALAWCQNLGNSLRTAQQLGIHDNTVRYRMQGFSKIVGVDLADTDTVLAVWIQLRCSDVSV